MSVPLISLACPKCGSELHPRTGNPTPATCFEDCLRRCDTCGIGFSNSRHQQTHIYRNPFDNIPTEVLAGAEETLLDAFNEYNRANKMLKFGFSSSEDALTWTVFSFLRLNKLLGEVVRDCGIVSRNTDEPCLLLWGVPQPSTTTRVASIQKRLIEVCDQLGENPRHRSEPDVILDCADDGLVIIEVKYRSGNNQQRFGAKHVKYLCNTDAFAEPKQIRRADLYELTRNWRIGVELADGRPFTLINLVVKNREPNQIRQFCSGLNYQKGAFRVATWNDFLNRGNPSKWPLWFKDYLKEKLPKLMSLIVEQQ